MPDDIAEDYEKITIGLPVSMVEQLRDEARQSFRTLDGQIAWRIQARMTRAPGPQRGSSVFGPELLGALRDLHLRQGQPSVRDIAKKADRLIGHSTASEILNGSRAVSWRVLEILVKALDGDVDYFRQLWVRDQHEY